MTVLCSVHDCSQGESMYNTKDAAESTRVWQRIAVGEVGRKLLLLHLQCASWLSEAQHWVPAHIICAFVCTESYLQALLCCCSSSFLAESLLPEAAWLRLVPTACCTCVRVLFRICLLFHVAGPAVLLVFSVRRPQQGSRLQSRKQGQQLSKE